MNYWKVILATVVIFGAGVVTGSLMVNSIHREQPIGHRPPSGSEARPFAEMREPQSHSNGFLNLPRPPRPPEILGDNFVQQLDDKIQLTTDQRAAIQKIIADGQERNRSIWTNNSGQMRAVIQDVRHRIRENLNPEQQKQFEELMKRVPRRPGSTNAPANLLPTNPPAVAPKNASGV